MPATTFELIFIYYVLRGKLGKQFGFKVIAEEMGISWIAIRKRFLEGINLGILADTNPLPRGNKTSEWLKLTDKGAKAFLDALSGEADVVYHAGIFCMDRSIFPDTIKWRYLSNRHEYHAYLETLRNELPA